MDKITPKDKTIDCGEAGLPKPFARGNVGDASRDCKLLRVQRLIQLALLENISQLNSVKLSLVWHIQPSSEPFRAKWAFDKPVAPGARKQTKNLPLRLIFLMWASAAPTMGS